MSRYKTELDSNRSIVFLYIKNFNWINKDDEKLLEGHPLTGRVYRAVKDSRDNTYYLRIEQVSKENLEKNGVLGIAIKGLYELNEGAFEASIEEIDEENIVDFDIDSKDYQTIGEWVKVNNQDFVDFLKDPRSVLRDPDSKPTPTIKIGDHEVPKLIKDGIQEIVQSITEGRSADIHNKAKKLSWLDPMTLEGISNYLDHATELAEDFDPEIISLSDELATHRDLGKGANLYGALLHIDNYIHSKSNGSRLDLYKAIDSLIREIVRLNILGK